MAVHRVVVGQGYARPDEGVLLDHGAGREVAAGLHAGAISDPHSRVDRAEAADRRPSADYRAVANLGVVADPGAVADHDAGVDHHVTADQYVLADLDAFAEQQPGRSVGGLQGAAGHYAVARFSFLGSMTGGMLAAIGRKLGAGRAVLLQSARAERGEAQHRERLPSA